MTNLTVFGPGFRDGIKDFDKFFVGFEDQLKRISKLHDSISTKGTSNYPPYNIRKTGDSTYLIQIAVSGFSKDDISIEVNDGTLTVTGASKENTDTNDFIFRGIAMRDFTRSFALDDQVVVNGASMADGMVSIELERIIPEQRKARKISIDTPKSTVEKQLLTE